MAAERPEGEHFRLPADRPRRADGLVPDPPWPRPRGVLPADVPGLCDGRSGAFESRLPPGPRPRGDARAGGPRVTRVRLVPQAPDRTRRALDPGAGDRARTGHRADATMRPGFDGFGLRPPMHTFWRPDK